MQPVSKKQFLQIHGIILDFFFYVLVFPVLFLQAKDFWQYSHFRMFLI